MTAGSNPSISSLAVRPVAHRLNGLGGKALKALAIMFLLQPASCGNLRSEGLAEKVTQSHQIQAGIVNSTNHAHSDIISKMTEFMLLANKVHDEL